MFSVIDLLSMLPIFHHINFEIYIENIQVFGVNMSFISLSEVKIFHIS